MEVSLYVALKLGRDARLRLFEQLHQDMEEDWHRAGGSVPCEHCGVEYRWHPINDTTKREDGSGDHRLCNGMTVHL